MSTILNEEKISKTEYDAIVIGSGFGGCMTAYQLVAAGKRVLMLERGDWVKRGEHNWAVDGSIDLTPHYSKEIPYRVLAGGLSPVMGAYTCVGGPSVFYGAVSMRLREADFAPGPDIAADSSAEWPLGYAALEPYYTAAEQILGIAGDENGDPTEPPRSGPYPQPPGRLSDTSRMIQDAAAAMNLRPFKLPLAINYHSENGRRACVACSTCDTFACAVEAKNDLATTVLPGLLAKGMTLRPNTIATKLLYENGSVAGVLCFDKAANHQTTYHGKVVILSAGSLASPHLLLASKLEEYNPGGHTVGHYLMRHCNAISFGFFARKPNPKNEFHKQLGIHDFYFGHESIESPPGKLGSMQQLQTPPIGLVHSMVPWPFGKLLGLGVPHLTGLLVMAEDQPRFDNHVAVDTDTIDRFGLPQLLVSHHYTGRDYAARDALLDKAGEILKTAGAIFCYRHMIKTFSHAVGTVRMGRDPGTSALDEHCRFRGVENLFVVDGSFMPTSGGLNPSLTISANALRVGKYIVNESHLI